MVDLHCCVNVCCTAVIQLYIYMHSFHVGLISRVTIYSLVILLYQF